MPRKAAELYEWEGDFRSIQEIADMEGVDYRYAYGWVKGGHTSRSTVRVIHRGKKEAKAIVAPERPQLLLENIVITISPSNPLYKMLNWLAKTSNTNHSLALCELFQWISEGHTIGSDTHEAVKARLIERHNGQDMGDDYEFTQTKQAPLKAWQAELIPLLERLESENEELRDWKEKTIRRLKLLSGEIEND